MPRKPAILWLVLAVCITLAPACSQLPPLKLRLVERADPEVAQAYSQLRFPDGAKAGEDLDIVVRQSGGSITLTNREPREYHNLRLWLNREYVTEVPVVRIGNDPDNRIELDRCINRFGEPFPVGTFLAPDRADHVVVAVVVPMGDGDSDAPQVERQRLVVRRGDFMRTYAGLR